MSNSLAGKEIAETLIEERHLIKIAEEEGTPETWDVILNKASQLGNGVKETMDLVKSLIELQINYQVYNGFYNCDRQTVIRNLKPTLLYLELTDLSVKTMASVIDGIVDHPVNLKTKNPETTDHSSIQKTMLTLKEIILFEYKKHRGNKTRGKYKKLNPTITSKTKSREFVLA